MEYVIGPVLALLIGMKFSDYKSKDVDKRCYERYLEITTKVDEKIREQNELMSTQTLKVLMPVAKSVTAINQQLGL